MVNNWPQDTAWEHEPKIVAKVHPDVFFSHCVETNGNPRSKRLSRGEALQEVRSRQVLKLFLRPLLGLQKPSPRREPSKKEDG